MKTRVFILLLTIFSLSCSTYHVSKIDGVAQSPKLGLIYFLPKIEYDVIITYDIITPEQSEYFNDTDFKTEVDKILGFEYINSNKPKYKLKSVELKQVILPDESQTYFVTFKKKNALFVNKKFLFELTEQGFLKNGNIVSQDNSSAIVLSTLEATTSFVKSAYTLPAGAKAGGTRMEIIVKKILSLRKEREDLITGNKAPDLNYSNSPILGMYEKLKEEEEKLLSLLAGTEKTKSVTKVIRYKPQIGSNQNLFYFSPTKGLSNSSTGVADGENITLSISDESNHQKNLQAFLISKSTLAKSKHGLYYRLPVTTVVKIQDNNKEYYNSLQVIPQLGSVAFLPNRIGIVKNDISYTLDPTTGALLKYDANSEGVNMDKVNALLTNAATLPEALKKPKEQKSGFEEIEKAIKSLEYDIKYQQLKQKYDSLKKG
jgi:hypothetical protein